MQAAMTVSRRNVPSPVQIPAAGVFLFFFSCMFFFILYFPLLSQQEVNSDQGPKPCRGTDSPGNGGGRVSVPLPVTFRLHGRCFCFVQVNDLPGINGIGSAFPQCAARLCAYPGIGKVCAPGAFFRFGGGGFLDSYAGLAGGCVSGCGGVDEREYIFSRVRLDIRPHTPRPPPGARRYCRSKCGWEEGLFLSRPGS